MREKQRGVVMLDELRRRASERAWRGKGGLTDRDVYLSLIEVAQDHGSVCDDGMRISISVRELSQRARSKLCEYPQVSERQAHPRWFGQEIHRGLGTNVGNSDPPDR